MKKTLAFMAISAVLSVAIPAQALTATQSIQKEVVTRAADGTEVMQLTSAELVTPGERVVYTLDYTNDQADPANDLVLTMPIPAEITYLEGSAESASTIVTYSADGGQTFASREAVMVAGEDGMMQPAGSDALTHIRWNIAGPVAPGESGALVYKGMLK